MNQERIKKEATQSQPQQPNITGIPTQMKLDFERRSGLSFDDVRVHYNSDQPAKLGALAYTQGTQVYIGPGQSQHLGHELGHVVQQKLGMVQADTRHASGAEMNTDPALERQADLLGNGAVLPFMRRDLLRDKMPVQPLGLSIVQTQPKHIFSTVKEVEDTFPIKIDPKTSFHPYVMAAPLTNSTYPTMVFESMGTTVGCCQEIYDQSCKYSGDTICVFALNTQLNDDSTTRKPEINKVWSNFSDQWQALGEWIQRKAQEQTARQTAGQTAGQAAANPVHLLYCYPLWWKSPSNADKGYSMPYIEARIFVMQKAKEIIDEHHSGGKFLYRWIDGDARDDTTSALPLETLSNMVPGWPLSIATGSYRWRSEAAASDQAYSNFIEEINNAELCLRDEYYKLLSQEINGDSDSSDVLPFFPEPYENDHLPGFYFPETVLMMNKTAHDRILETADSLQGKLSENSQDKESMRILQIVWKECNGGNINLHPMISQLHVTKPIKHEFDAGTYLGANLRSILMEKKPPEYDVFITGLKNLRQSAFNNKHWFFLSNEKWDDWSNPLFLQENMDSGSTDTSEKHQTLLNQCRREKADELYDYLKENWDEIKAVSNRYKNGNHS